MTPEEVNQAIIGAQYREARELKLTRIIAFLIAKYLGVVNKGVKIFDFYPLMFDKKKTRKPKKGTPEWIRMEETFRKRDAMRSKKK